MMSVVRVSALVALVGSFAVGCVTTHREDPERKAIVAFLAQWKDAFARKDLPAVMALYSERFNTNGRDKAAQAKAIQGELDDGLVDNAVITVENATITISGGCADVSPITFSGRTGSATVRLRLSKEQGLWLVTGMDDK